MILALLVAASLASPPQVSAPAASRHWTNGQLPWSAPLAPEFPRRESGRVEAHAICTVGERGRVRDCRVLRVGPEGSRFGTNLLTVLRRARLVEGRASPGDTYTFRVWACTEPRAPEGRCEPLNLPFPEDEANGPAS